MSISRILKKNGVARSWKDLEGLNITEEDFVRGPCYLGIDNSGVIAIFIRTRIPGDPYNDKFTWCRRPKLGEAFFDYSGCPEWLQQKFRDFWRVTGFAMKSYYDAKDASSYRVGGFFD